MTLTDILEKHADDWLKYQESGELSDVLMNDLYEYYLNSGDMPYGVAKARTGDPSTWIMDRLDEFIEDPFFG